MKKFIQLSFTCLLAISAVPAFAAPASQDKSPGGSDACGLGWQVTDKKTLVASTTRGTTNYFIPYTFGMTTGTLGCDKHDIAKQEVEAARYAVNNYDSISIDMAQGRGENLTAFAETMGCSDVNALGRATQRNFEAIGSAPSGIELYENVRTVIRQDSDLHSTCTNVI